MTTDDALKAWRDAAIAGGLPTPHRTRWQALRAGVVNLWEFEAAEYWYADGWAQLTGSNETGKSSLMALTTLIPWLADTSSDKIDTLGRSGKQFSYYVRPTGREGDRRDASASFYHGWLWVEYARVVDDEPEFFTTLLYASARTGSPRTNLTWCTAVGHRVRDGLRLTEGRDVVVPKTIDLPGFEVHPSATSYRAALASRLLGGSVDRLENVGKILKVTRTPKLGAQLDARFVTERLRDALPELNRSEVDRLAEGWDQLDQIRDDLQRARDAADEVAGFARRAWRPWLGAVLRLAADEAVSQQSDFDRVTRGEREAKERLAESRREEAELTRQQDETQLSADTTRAEADALRASASYRDAEARSANARQAEVDADRAAERRDRSAAELGAAEARAVEATDLTRGREERATDARETAERRTDDVRRHAMRAGVAVGEPVDIEHVRQSARERREAIARVRALITVYETANQQAAKLETAHDAHASAAEEAARNAAESWAAAEAERDDVASALHAWAGALPEPAGDLERWIEQLPRTAEAGLRLAASIRADWYEPHHLRHSDRSRLAEAALEEAEAAAAELEARIVEIETAGVAAPEGSTLWRRRDRDDAPGAPLWRLLNPRDDAAPSDTARVEAALAASGLLDAWVDEAGVRDEHDTFITVPDPGDDGPRLSRMFTVADDAGPAGGMAQALLDGVGLRAAGEALPGSGVAVATDGRWRTSALTGTAEPLHDQAEWLGEAAREAQRARRLAELRAELDRARRAADAARAELDAARSALQALADALAGAPDDQPLNTLLVQAEERSAGAERAAAVAERALRDAKDARATADGRHADMLRLATDSRLPTTVEELLEIRDVLAEVQHAAGAWKEARRDVEQAEAELAVARAAEAARAEERDAARARLSQDDEALAVARATATALREAIDAEDGALFDRVRALDSAAQRAIEALRGLATRLNAVSAGRGRAESELATVEAERERTTELRNAAHARLRELIDARVPEHLLLELPEQHSSSVEHVRAQAAEIRRAVRPRQWQLGEPRENAERVGDLRVAMESQARDARGALEQGGRSLQIIPEDRLVRVDVTVNSNGQVLPIDEALPHLAGVVETLESSYDAGVQQTLNELLGSTFLEHMRDQIGVATTLVHDINRVLADHPTGTNHTTLRIKLEPGANRHVLDAITGPTLANPDVAAQVREFLREKVDEAKRTAVDEGHPDWRDSLADHLDYRNWYGIALERRFGASNWGPLTTRSYAELSGGARAVMLMLPLIGALAALYQHMPDAPRPLWLDEAFDGLDATNRSVVMRLLREFDLDVLLAGPGRLVNVAAVPTAAIYQVVRAREPEPGADLTLELWAGNTLEAIELPLSWLDDAPPPEPDAQDALL